MLRGGFMGLLDGRLDGGADGVPGLAAGFGRADGTAVRMELAAGERIIWRRVREAWARQRGALEALNLTWLNLTLGQPAISRENILLIEGVHDLCVGTKPIEDLWRAWRQPDIWRLPHGHVSTVGALKAGLTNGFLIG